MTRLPRSRKGKTPIDVTVTEQRGLKRVRLSVGKEHYGRINSDLDAQEVADLVTMLIYHASAASGVLPEPEPEPDGDKDIIDIIIDAGMGLLHANWSVTTHALRTDDNIREFLVAVLESDIYLAGDILLHNTTIFDSRIEARGRAEKIYKHPQMVTLVRAYAEAVRAHAEASAS